MPLEPMWTFRLFENQLLRARTGVAIGRIVIALQRGATVE